MRLKGASGESEGLRRYDKENLLWQSTVAIRSDPVGSFATPRANGSSIMSITKYGLGDVVGDWISPTGKPASSAETSHFWI